MNITAPSSLGMIAGFGLSADGPIMLAAACALGFSIGGCLRMAGSVPATSLTRQFFVQMGEVFDD
jgi:hypothetical protein